MSNIRFFDLSIPAPKRLQMMRSDLATHAARFPYCPEYIKPKTWRDVRAYRLDNWAGAFGVLSGGRDVWYSHLGEYFRDERDAPSIARSTALGWYTDEDGCETAVGIVARLPHGRFLAGYRWTANDERVYFPGVFDDERDAALMADEHARVFAEHARDAELEDREREREESDRQEVEDRESDLALID